MLEYFHLTLVVWCSISIKLWWFGGVFQLNHQSLIEILHHTTKAKWKYSNIQPKFNVNIMNRINELKKYIIEQVCSTIPY